MALRVGGQVLTGMWSLGEVAYTAARARISNNTGAASSTPTTAGHQPSFGIGAGFTNIFSRSAPAASRSHTLQRSSSVPRPTDDGQRIIDLSDDIDSAASSPPSYTPSHNSALDRSHGAYVTVVDLSSLLQGSPPSSPEPDIIAEFMALKRYSISLLRFSTDGMSVLIVPEDGQVVRVLQLRPQPRVAQPVHSQRYEASDDDVQTRVSASSISGDKSSIYDIYRVRLGICTTSVEAVRQRS